jgi:DNA-binding transcriptional MerR regulator
MLAGDVAKALGVGVQTLHYYEREGLIPPPARSKSGYRLFTPDLVERVAFIRKAQTLGLPLAEIRDILSLAEQGASPCGRVQRSLAAKLAEVDRRLEELQAFRRDLAGLIDRSGELSQRRGAAQLCAIVEDAPAITSQFVTPPLGRKARQARVR